MSESGVVEAREEARAGSRLTADDLTKLARSRLFRGVSQARLLRSLRPSGEVCLRAGAVLLEPGQRNALLYLLMSGRLGVYLDEDARIPVAHVEPGECVGEVSIIDEDSACASVVALEPSRLLIVSAVDLWDLMAQEPGIALNLVHVLAERIRRNNAAVLANFGRQSQVGMLPDIDPVTGLHNRRWMHEVFLRQIDRCARTRCPVSLAIVDLDHFRSVNDTFGHQAGDRVLAQIGRVMQRQFRPTDLLARYGGEEFAVLLPQTRAQEAVAALERVRLIVAETQTSVAQRTTVKVRISAGVAEWCTGWSLEELLACADRGLQRAKASGRNCVLVGDCPN